MSRGQQTEMMPLSRIFRTTNEMSGVFTQGSCIIKAKEGHIVLLKGTKRLQAKWASCVMHLWSCFIYLYSWHGTFFRRMGPACITTTGCYESALFQYYDILTLVFQGLDVRPAFVLPFRSHQRQGNHCHFGCCWYRPRQYFYHFEAWKYYLQSLVFPVKQWIGVLGVDALFNLPLRLFFLSIPL